jgi:antitoxin (DNA-binding transcriptional repressor) of toxin-antitoxin stability system
MQRATVRDLRNHFSDVARWIEQGEAVTITPSGAAVAPRISQTAQYRLGIAARRAQAPGSQVVGGRNRSVLVAVAGLSGWKPTPTRIRPSSFRCIARIHSMMPPLLSRPKPRYRSPLHQRF